MMNNCLLVMFALLPRTVTSGCYMHPLDEFYSYRGIRFGSIENTNQEKCLQFCLQGSSCVWLKYDTEIKECIWFKERSTYYSYAPDTTVKAFEKMCDGTLPKMDVSFIMTDLSYKADIVSNTSQKSESFCAYTCFRNDACNAYVYQDSDEQCLI